MQHKRPNLGARCVLDLHLHYNCELMLRLQFEMRFYPHLRAAGLHGSTKGVLLLFLALD